MAKQIASANAAADLATASEVTGGKSVGDLIDNLPEGVSTALTDNGAIQGESAQATEVRDTIEMPYYDRNGEQIGVSIIVRY